MHIRSRQVFIDMEAKMPKPVAGRDHVDLEGGCGIAVMRLLMCSAVLGFMIAFGPQSGCVVLKI